MGGFIVFGLCALLLLLVGLIFAGAVYRAKQNKKVFDAAAKYLKS
jgi:hypothetical protein